MKSSTQTSTLRRTWLVQRLQKPRSFGLAGMKDNPFSFGGGLRNGGLSDEAMGLLRGIFSFDYMGSAEFEFGAVPEALSAIAKDHKRLTSGSLTIALADVQKGWDEKHPPAAGAEAEVFYLCRAQHSREVSERIRAMAAEDHKFKESTRLPSTLRPAREWDGETVGWLELDNGFMFFTDEGMWEQTCALFGVEVTR